MLTAMMLAVPRRTNIPRPTKKDPKDTLERAFNKLAWGFFFGRREYKIAPMRLCTYLTVTSSDEAQTIPNDAEWCDMSWVQSR